MFAVLLCSLLAADAKAAIECIKPDRDTGTMYLADSSSVRPNLQAFRQHSLISAPVHPSSSGNSPGTPYLSW